MGFPGCSAGKESSCNAGDLGSIPGLGRSAGEEIGYPLQYSWVCLVVQLAKNLPAVQKILVWFLGQEDSLEKRKTTHSSILAWRTERCRQWFFRQYDRKNKIKKIRERNVKFSQNTHSSCITIPKRITHWMTDVCVHTHWHTHTGANTQVHMICFYDIRKSYVYMYVCMYVKFMISVYFQLNTRRLWLTSCLWCVKKDIWPIGSMHPKQILIGK